MRLQTSFRDQHPSWVPTTGKASLLTTNQSRLSQVLVKLAPLFKEGNLTTIWKSNSSRAMECWIRSEIWRETWATVPALPILWGPCVPGQNPVRHCVEELCKLSSVAGVPHWAEACHRHHTSCSATAFCLVVVRCSVFTFLGLLLLLNVSLWAAVFINHPTHRGANWILGQNPGFFPQRAGRPKEVYFESFFLRENVVLTSFL